jgi:hypothetical protein
MLYPKSIMLRMSAELHEQIRRDSMVLRVSMQEAMRLKLGAVLPDAPCIVRHHGETPRIEVGRKA